jgi:hypothetical protein
MAQILKPKAVVVEPGCDLPLVVKAPRNFRLRRLIVDRAVTENFAITALSFNKNNQFIGPGAVPALLFAHDAYPENYDFDLLNEDDEIKLSVANLSSKVRSFAVGLLGDSEPIRQHERNQFLGLGFTSVPEGGSCNISVQPGLTFFSTFRGERLVIPSTIAEHFEVTDIKVGKVSQMRSTQPVPATVFTEQTPYLGRMGLALDVCSPSMFITISVENKSKRARSFCGALIGTVCIAS